MNVIITSKEKDLYRLVINPTVAFFSRNLLGDSFFYIEIDNNSYEVKSGIQELVKAVNNNTGVLEVNYNAADRTFGVNLIFHEDAEIIENFIIRK